MLRFETQTTGNSHYGGMNEGKSIFSKQISFLLDREFHHILTSSAAPSSAYYGKRVFLSLTRRGFAPQQLLRDAQMHRCKKARKGRLRGNSATCRMPVSIGSRLRKHR